MTQVATLGEVGPHDDVSYTGDVSSSPVSADYFRAKYLEFQQALNAADSAYQAGLAVYDASDPPDPDLYTLLMDYEARAGQYKGIAETLNMGAQVANSLGVRMPQLSIPQSLGALPAFVVPAVVLTALSAAVAAVTWTKAFTAGMESTVARIQAMPENSTKPQIVAALNQTIAARKAADNPLTAAANAIGSTLGWVKLIAIFGLGYMAWKAADGFFDR